MEEGSIDAIKFGCFLKLSELFDFSQTLIKIGFVV